MKSNPVFDIPMILKVGLIFYLAMEENTRFAFLEGEPADMVGYPEYDIGEKTRIKIPKKMIERLSLDESPDNEVAIWNNENNFVSIAKDEEGYNPATVDLEEASDGYWIEVTEDMSELRPLDGGVNYPIVILGCGEIWIFNHQKFWNKIAAEVPNDE